MKTRRGPAPKPWLLILAVLAAFSVMAAACGSDDGDAADEGTEETDADAGSDDEEAMEDDGEAMEDD